MKLSATLSGVICALLTSTVCRAAQIPFSIQDSSERPRNAAESQWTLPRNSTNAAVVFDKYSLALANGKQRLFVFAAEFHPWRIPVPSLWRDVLQKIRSAGFNTVSIYTHWGLIQPSPDPASIDLTGVNDLEHFLTLAKQTGLFVIVRPGPYINAETTMGGMAPWTVNINATLRTDDPDWHSAWKPYIDAISQVIVKHQVVYNGSKADFLQGGHVILVQADNEYKTGRAERAYMTELVRSFKAAGVTVPITYNDPSRDSNFVEIVDLYGLDSYPQRFDCSHPETWVPLRDDYLQYHLKTNPAQPFYIPEFQGGSYDPYGGPGYQACLQMTDAKFVRVANQALWAQRVTLLSIYMVYGGTNWGALAEPDVYTSYDYGAALTEERQTTPKYAEYKRQGYFLASFPDLAMTDQIEDGPGLHITYVANIEESSDDVKPKSLRTTVLRNPDTHSRFYVVRHEDSTSRSKIQFALEIETLGQKVVIGAKLDKPIQDVVGTNHLNGRDSHIIPIDQRLGDSVILRYSTANVFRVATFDNVLSIDLDADPGHSFQFSFLLEDGTDRVVDIHMFETHHSETDEGSSARSNDLANDYINVSEDGRLVTGYLPAFTEHDTFTRTIIYTTAHGKYILLQAAPTSMMQRDFSTPARFFSPVDSPPRIHTSSLTDRFFGHSADSVIVRNIDMLSNATYSSEEATLDTLHLWGSASADRAATLLALPTLNKIYWNGLAIRSIANNAAPYMYSIKIPGPSQEALAWKAPSLASLIWKEKDSLPEVSETTTFDDKLWRSANKSFSFNPYANDPSIDTQHKVLFASEYGFHGNNIVWRGAFHVQEDTKMKLKDFAITLEGGRFFAFSVWLNGNYLGSVEADNIQSAANKTFSITTSAMASGKNVVTILQDHMGLDMENGELPIGLRGAKTSSRSDHRLGLEAVKLPRGIVKFSFPSLRKAKITEPELTWKVQGNYMGEQTPDKVRRSLNEGGLHAEVQGWHLPGYDASNWTSSTPHATTKASSRVMFYRTDFKLDVPREHDIGFQLRFNSSHTYKGNSANFRAQLYVNGWQMGKYIHRFGPQTVFPVHSGILEHNGDNTLGVSIWNLGEEDFRFDPSTDLELHISHRTTGLPRDGYSLSNPTWAQLRAA